MAMLTTKIVPDKSKDSYLCGETISGKVMVIIHEECKDRKLLLALGCRGTASAPQQQIKYFIDTEQMLLFTGDWSQGTYEYPFSVTAPDGYSYDGTILTVGWYLRAGVIGARETVNRHTKQDSDLEGEDRSDILLGPGEVTRNDVNRKKDSQVIRRETAASMRGCLLPSLFMFLGGAMAAWWGGDKGLYLPGFVVALVGAVLTGVAVWQALIARKIAMIELRIGSTVVWPGEQILCSMKVKAKTPFEIEQATITLEGWEHVKKFTGMHRTTGPVNKHIIHKAVHEMRLPLKRLPAGASVELIGECTVPFGAAGTIDFDNEVKLLWRLEPRIKITGSPDWFDLQPITLLPRVPAPVIKNY
jgi:hypothetical protein